MTTHSSLAYEIKSRRIGINFVPHVVVQCGSCTGRLEFVSVGSAPQEHIAKAIRRKGWEFELYNRRSSRCPECIVLHANRRKSQPNPTVSLLGKPISIPQHLLPAPVPEIRPPEIEPKPLREYRIILRSTRSLDEIVKLLGLNPDAVEKYWVVNPELSVVPKTNTIVPPVVPETKKPPSKLAGRVLPIKYQHPKNPDLTWAGRGNTPVWVRKYLNVRSRKLSDLLIT